MGWFFSLGTSLHRPSRPSRRAPKRNRSWILEDLEGRRLLSQAIQSVVTLPTIGTSNMISGPDGDLWVGVNQTPISAVIDRIGLNGSVTSFSIPENGPGGSFAIDSLTTGPDGYVWFDAQIGPNVNDTQVVIGNVTPAGVVTEFPPIPVPAGLTASAGSIVSGPDGDLWFGSSISTPRLQDFNSQNFIGRVTTAGAVTLFPISSFNAKSQSLSVDSLVAGADGNLWFTEGSGRFVFGRLSPSGVVTRFRIPDLHTAAQVANGPNGSLIVTGLNRKFKDEVFSVTAADAVTRDAVPQAISKAFFKILGSADGSLWLTSAGFQTFKLGEITASGVATSYDLSSFIPGRQNFGTSMVLGQDGNLYLLDSDMGTNEVSDGLPIIPTTVYRLSPSQLPPPIEVSSPRSRG